MPSNPVTVASVLERVRREGFHPDTTREERSAAALQLMALVVLERAQRKRRVRTIEGSVVPSTVVPRRRIA